MMLILALGNSLRGDDGVGVAVLEYLQKAAALPPEITLLDGGTPGLETLLLIQGHEQVIIVDAADMGLDAGEWRQFTPAALQPGNLALRGTLHSAGLAEALVLGEAMNLLPRQIEIYGIQPENTDRAYCLSQAVLAAVPAVAQAILKRLNGANDEQNIDC